MPLRYLPWRPPLPQEPAIALIVAVAGASLKGFRVSPIAPGYSISDRRIRITYVVITYGEYKLVLHADRFTKLSRGGKPMETPQGRFMIGEEHRSPTMSDPAPRPAGPGAIFRVFLLAGAVSFGGGVVAYLREYIVNEQGWLNDDEFLDALELSETLPGLNSVNMSVIIGDRLRGAMGAAIAATGLILPGMIVVMTLGVLWNERRHNPEVTAFLIGVAAAAVGLLTTVTLQLGHKQFTRVTDLLFIAATFAAVSLLKWPLVWVLLTIGPVSIGCYWPREHPTATSHHFAHLRERLVSHRAHWRH